ncbi:helix-turn-helix transcriptional regulator [Bacillus sp. RM2(2019)]|uniref:helix-turn-helix domain-containing protein n=1 Tax=Bacillus sp. RM2(2019) TaxID=2651636 RepID=UPI00124F67E1|nr:helix-turn-helix transcriptional regulator [Bacillus sp. RM2(2019)]KAB2370985.1 ImmA/IrrE family metallo-endopeptidase [Bacillus sp. RM2(2019)]
MNARDRIIKKRKELGLNQTELAKRAGLKAPAISQYESGARNPSYDALIRLANALNVKVDYLVSGVESSDHNSLDLKSEVLLKMFNSSSVSNKEKIFEYVMLTTGYNNLISDVWFNNPRQYADYIVEHYTNNIVPVDVFEIANKLNITIIKGDLDDVDAEAMLLKRSNMIILDMKTTHNARIKSTVATLIGHLIIPWHTEEVYYCRKSKNSSLLTEHTEEMEARQFAADLITPNKELKKDFSIYNEKNVSLVELKKLADEKYQVSLYSLCNRLVDFNSKRFAVIESKDLKINKVVSGHEALKEKDTDLDNRTQASMLLRNNSILEEFKEDKIPADAWLLNPNGNEFVYESTVFNPLYGSTLTILTIKK